MREVKSQDWGAFCNLINQNENGGRVSVHKVEPSGAKIELAREAAFEQIEFGKRDGCNDQISLRLGSDALKRHDIIEPIRIQLAESENGSAYQSMIVEAEDGVTILTFHPVLKAAWLDNLALR